MTIYWAGGEDTSFIITGIYGYTMSSGGSVNRSAFSRVATGLNINSYNSPPDRKSVV